jgi:pre-mRNA-splicing factor CDC5/CEF1
VRKTPKQCKARWYEWLDPSIKKTEWSKEEDEKLLHLAKLMPTQWRTIAPIVGRTATQCLERYQKLLDEAESREAQEGEGSGSGLGLTGPGGPESAPSAEDVRKLRPGEIDPDPETKPARPDPVDMDEDEKEMLSEARARLANTQGKKAKRKARERALEEARRLAMLQKRRELKAAGINTRLKPPKKGMDYMTDIPFEKQPVAGFYDTSDENSREVRAPIGMTIRQMDDPNRARHEEDARKQKQKEADKKKQSEQGKAVFSKEKEEQLRKLKEAEQISKRRRLNLPEAQVGQRELDEIVKMGMASETARKLVADGSESTEGLLGEYSALERARDARTPRTAPEEDTVMREARNLRNMANMQTPLLGDANVEMLKGTGHQGAMPSSVIAQTPNPLLTPAHRGGLDPGATPLPGRLTSATPRSETPMRTPFRDNLGLNADEGSIMGDTPRNLKRAQQSAKMQLQMGLRGLPAPKNDFELVLDDEDGQDQQNGSMVEDMVEEDAAERDERLKRMEEDRLKMELARRTKVVQRNLPRPANVDVEAMLASLPSIERSKDVEELSRRMIEEEMVHLLKHDSVLYPIAGSKEVGGRQQSGLPMIPDEHLSKARKEIHQEMAKTWGFPGANEEVLKRIVIGSLDVDTEEGRERMDDLESALQQLRDNLAWSTERKAWAPTDEMTPEEIKAGQEARLDAIRVEMTRQAGIAAKEEKRMAKVLGGYQARSKALAGDIRTAFTSFQEAAVQQIAFERLSEMESMAVTERQKALEVEVQTLERRERMAQSDYKEKEELKRVLQAEIDAMEDELAMIAAEKINEEALAAIEQQQ